MQKTIERMQQTYISSGAQQSSAASGRIQTISRQGDCLLENVNTTMKRLNDKKDDSNQMARKPRYHHPR